MPPPTDGRRRTRQNLFANDLKALMYAFGDAPNPYPETVAVLEDIVQEYLALMCQEAQRCARAAHRQKLKVEDFKFALRNDPRKLGRVEKLLQLQREIEVARKTFDVAEGKALGRMFDEGAPPGIMGMGPPPPSALAGSGIGGLGAGLGANLGPSPSASLPPADSTPHEPSDDTRA